MIAVFEVTAARWHGVGVCWPWRYYWRCPRSWRLPILPANHGPDGKLFAMELFGNLVLPVLLPLTALLFAISALGSDIEDRTLIYSHAASDIAPDPGSRQVAGRSNRHRSAD